MKWVVYAGAAAYVATSLTIIAVCRHRAKPAPVPVRQTFEPIKITGSVGGSTPMPPFHIDENCPPGTIYQLDTSHMTGEGL